MANGKGKTALNIILTIFIVLFVINFFRSIVDGVPLTFGAFLETLETVPSVSLDLAIPSLAGAGDWGLFEFLRTFLNSIIGILNIGIFFTSNIINLLLILIWVLRFFFLPV